jgi:hypothetical protein
MSLILIIIIVYVNDIDTNLNIYADIPVTHRSTAYVEWVGMCRVVGISMLLLTATS